MRTVRASWRLVLVAKTTLFFYLLWVLGSLLFLPWPHRRARCRDFCFRNWARWLLRILNARVETRGKAPAAPFFLVANHLSYLDILVLASRIDAVFIAKSEVSSWPIMGRLCRSIGTLFIDRNLRRDIPRVIRAIDRVLGGGQGVVLFPEGTSTPGFEVAPFRPSLLEAAARGRIPVCYAALSYRTDDPDQPAHSSLCWWGDMPFAGHFWNLLALPGFSASLSFGSDTIESADRKQLAQRLRLAVSGLFVPVAGSGEAAAKTTGSRLEPA